MPDLNHMIRSPIVGFELRRGSYELLLINIAQTNIANLSTHESRALYLHVRRAADGGSAFAMCLCATWPDTHGQGKPTDGERYCWAERSAQSNYPPGLFELALCLEKGIGVQPDLPRARDLYERSSAGGFGFAAHRLGTGYMEGHFGDVDVQKAVHFMELAYEHGEPLGALNLGQWFESGEKVPRDVAAAVRWFERASDMGDFFATLRLQVAYTLGELGLHRETTMAERYEARLLEQTTVETRSDKSSRE